MKVLIIGGVAGGATAAARLRRLDENAEIIIIERSGYVSYANCGLPYYIGGEITDRSTLTLQTPESFKNRFRIDVRVREKAVSVDRTSKTVRIHRLSDGTEYTESYDKLILSPGAHPVVPQLPGIKSKRIMTLRTVEDTFRIYSYVYEHSPKSAVIIGGGFIGLETAENLKRCGLDVTILQRGSHVMPPLDEDMAAPVHTYMRKNGIDLHLKASVTGFKETEKYITAVTSDGEFTADMAVMAIGVVPESTLARDAGLKLGIKGAIAVNTHMRTSDENIYAVGDAAEITDFISGKKTVVPLAGPANKQGRIAADNICGVESEYKGVQSSSILKLFDMTVASTGYNEKTAALYGFDYDYALLTSASHATYYPGAKSMNIKVLFEKDTGKILGAQIIGFDGADKRIDVLATAIRAGMTASELTELELAYAPPYSSAKDPVNMAGYVIENIITGKVKQIHWKEALEADGVILDTRTDFEYAHGHIDGAMHIPLDSLRERLSELPKGKKIYVHCQSGLRSYIACRILLQKGYDCYNIAGGYGYYDAVYKNK
ncbi:MAG: FAD-dependent oxidoreductase [Monoglobales bacterium]